MKRFVEIVNGKTSACFDWPHDEDPQYEEGSITVIDITGKDDPANGSTYADGVFTAPETVDPVIDPDAAKAAFDIQRKEKLEETDNEAISKMLEAIIAADSVVINDVRAAALLVYRETLRDMPDAQDFDPANPDWPEEV